MTQQAKIALKAAHMRFNLGRKSSASYAAKNGCHPRLYVIACQLLAAQKSGI